MGHSHRKLAASQLDELTRNTDFSREELKQWFEKFTKDYPSGYMTKEEFLKVYQDFYKTGNSKGFSEHVFRVFDVNQDGKIDFREFICSLSMTTRGTVDDKLKWAFNMYDINGDGRISATEVSNIVDSVQALANARDKNLNEKKVQNYFKYLDKNQDGELTMEEFIRGSKANPVFMKLLTDYIA